MSNGLPSDNALQPTANPLRGLSAAELGRWTAFQSAMRALKVSVGLTVLLGVCSIAGAQDNLTAEDAFRKGVELSEARKYREAIPYFLVVYRAFPQSESALWNLGIASAEVGAHPEALKYWTALRAQSPNDWRVLAKLIQTHQALGDDASRDRARNALFALRKSAPPDADVSRSDAYCREQMLVGGRKVFVFETFEPKGEEMLFFEFIVVLSDGRTEDYRISLGSYDAINLIAWETGALPRDKRLYHLDWYQDKAHRTYAFYESQPTYDTVRAQVLDILNGRAKPISSTTVR